VVKAQSHLDMLKKKYMHLLIIVILLLVIIRCHSPLQKQNNPQTMLWAWEKHVDLSFIDPQKMGVAFLSSSIYIKGKNVIAEKRFKPLVVPHHTFLIAVIRITTNHINPPEFTRELRTRVIENILEQSRVNNVRGIQIDFDATKSERNFYKALLQDLRKNLPPEKSLSITALVSWCMKDNWLEGLPVDEVVPMLFRMGPRTDSILHILESGNDFDASICRNALGISLDEPVAKIPPHRKLYIFSPHPFTPEIKKFASSH